MLKTPVIFLIFRRPKETSLVFEQIRKARPPKLFIVADGPRNSDEKILTDSTREVVSRIDWPCEVFRNYSDINLGCRECVSSGITWAFNHTEKAIILEDDCLPNETFFKYCEEMLVRYESDEHIMHIGGTNFQQDNSGYAHNIGDSSYYFSNIAQIWGWATWKRSWDKYDKYMQTWPNTANLKSFRGIFPNLPTLHYWKHMFTRLYRNETDTWDIAWTYTCFREGGMCIMPRVNLITNIGTNIGSAHKSSVFSNIPNTELHFLLIHPKNIKVNTELDLFTYKKIYGIKSSIFITLKYSVKDNLPFLFNYIKRLVK